MSSDRPRTRAGRCCAGLLLPALLIYPGDALAGDDADPPQAPQATLGDTLQARDTYIFTFRRGIPRSAIPARAAELTRIVGGALVHTYTDVVGGFAARMPSTAMLRLMSLAPDIVSVEPDSIDHILTQDRSCDPGTDACGADFDSPLRLASSHTVGSCTAPSPGEVSGSWGVNRVDAEQVHASICGLGRDLYIIDTGIDLDHPDLLPIDLSTSVNCVQAGCPVGGEDDNGHGTHVAGIAAARANGMSGVGVAPGATLHAVQVLRPSGIGFRSDIIAGIDWVAGEVANQDPDPANRVPVVANMSLGGSGQMTGNCTAGGFVGSDAYHHALCDAANLGVVFVVAAGNEGRDASRSVPAAYDDVVITVSATNKRDRWPRWSNRGDVVDIAAPGVGIVSTAMGGGTTKLSGTSMASPHVAGAVALYLQTTDVPASYDAFLMARDAVVSSAESIPDRRRHAEDLLDAEAITGPGS